MTPYLYLFIFTRNIVFKSHLLLYDILYSLL